MIMVVKIVLSILAGLFLWSFMEYLIHGILSHRFRTPVSTMHWQHHREPRRVFTSPLAPLIICPILWWFFSLAIGNFFAFVLIASTLCGFAYYEHAHWRIHFREPKTDYEKRMKAHHLAHHFCNARLYHGVTSRIWDWVFGTMNNTAFNNGTVNDQKIREEHYQKVAQTPPMQGQSNFREIYSLQGLRVLRDTFRKP